jgi:hypothetical protein
MQVQLELLGPATGKRQRYVDLSASVIIDPVTCMLTLQDVVDQSHPIPAVIEPERLRRFAFSGNRLTTEVRDAGGRISPTLVWQKAKGVTPSQLPRSRPRAR